MSGTPSNQFCIVPSALLSAVDLLTSHYNAPGYFIVLSRIHARKKAANPYAFGCCRGGAASGAKTMAYKAAGSSNQNAQVTQQSIHPMHARSAFA